MTKDGCAQQTDVSEWGPDYEEARRERAGVMSAGDFDEEGAG